MTDQPVTRTQTVMMTIRQRIASRSLVKGDKLPSIRALAGALGVSPSTVVEAYARLALEGIIRARAGSGFYVAGATPPLALAEIEPRLDRSIDPFWVSRQSLDSPPETLRPGCGWLPPEWMPVAEVRRAIRRLGREDDALLVDYGTSRGSPGLRRVLARQFAAEGLEVQANQIILTSSGTQAIDLVCRFMLQPGDTVLVDDPCYFNFQALLRAHRVRIVGVPFTAAGPDVEHFERALALHAPRLYITNSALHNPTGATLSPQVAHRVLIAAAAHNLSIVEDDIFADFEPEPSVRLAVLDGLSRVIRIGSFSKTISAAIRCGYIAARPDWIDGLVDLQIATNFGGPSPMAAAIVAGVLGDGGYRKHLDLQRLRLSRARQQVAAQLEEVGIRPWIMPRGGFYLWTRLPEGQDASRLAQAALRENIVLAPGNVFSVSQSATDFMRFNVAQIEWPRTKAALQHMLR